MASLWLLQGDEVVLAASASNDNYDVENAPEAVGATIVGDVLADQAGAEAQRDPGVRPRVRGESPTTRSAPCSPSPLVEEELADRRARPRQQAWAPSRVHRRRRGAAAGPGRQAVRALRTARQHEAEKKVEELDALLTVSREITSTLDLDRVMQTIVNATSALITYDRCAIGILEKGKLRLGAISGTAEVDRSKPDVKRLEELVQWVYFSGPNVSVTQGEAGDIVADRPETEEKFRSVFQETGMRSFYGVILSDEEGKLGALAFESKEPIVFDEGTQDLLQILVNQATVAVRNAQLYRQVPLAGFFKPLADQQRKLLAIPKQRRRAWVVGLAVAAVLLLVPWRLRIAGPARILPGHARLRDVRSGRRRRRVRKHEGDRVAAGDVIADAQGRGVHGEARGSRAPRSTSPRATSPASGRLGDAGALFEAQSRREELEARIALAREELRPHPPARAGLRCHRDAAHRGAGRPVLPPRRRALRRRGRAAPSSRRWPCRRPTSRSCAPARGCSLKINTVPHAHVRRGTVARLGARVREEGEDRFLIAEARADNPEGC